MNKIYYLFVCFFFLSITNIVAQDTLLVKLTKAGTLKKYIKKKQKQTLKKLTIRGEINSEDIDFLTTLAEINTLDLSDVELNDEKAKDNKGKYIKKHNVNYIQEQRNIDMFYNKDINILHIPTIKTLKELIMPQNQLFSIENTHLDKLTIVSEYAYRYIDNITFDSNERFEELYKLFKGRIQVDTIQFVGGKYYYKENHYFDRDTIHLNHFNNSRIIEYTQKYGTPFEDVNGSIIHPIKNCKDSLYININDLQKYFTKANFQKINNEDENNYQDEKNGNSSIILVHWNDSFNISTLTIVDSISPFAFNKSKIESITIPENVKVLPSHFLSDWHSLKEVNLNNVQEIGSYAFSGCENLKSVKAENLIKIAEMAFCNNKNLTSITFNKLEEISSKAFYKTSIKELIIPATIKKISNKAFDGSLINHIDFLGNTAPEIMYCKEFRELSPKFWQINYTIPNGAGLAYDKLLWKGIRMIEKGSNKQTEYDIVVDKPGTLKDILTYEMMTNAESLKIKGMLFHEDLIALDECKHLRFLDLTNTFITINDEERKKQAASSAHYGAILTSAFEALGNLYINGKVDEDSIRVDYNNAFDDSYKALLKAKIQCTIPKLSDIKRWGGEPFFKYLEEVKYPACLNCVEKIGDYMKKVILPQSATEIGSLCCYQTEIDLPDSLKTVSWEAFSGCYFLEKIVFPESLERCSGSAFNGCRLLKTIDFSKTKLNEFNCESSIISVKELPMLEELSFPESLTKLIDVGNILGDKGVKIYFKSKTAPVILRKDGAWNQYYNYTFRKGDTIYIPKNCRKGWSDFISSTEASVIEY